ncbi:hypothetical protein [Pseudomonas monteilii]|uniref:hypothetical protein n=1 Tax=Pseudomonas monteilii TaxID=76759 RepID=UPI001E5FE9C7|nr:hypothetical protein [Pseudomonas monteilii]MCE0926007.1 hypothetical protein [Pseudomonas monteilii]MCE0934694.1 hypothetical protein [Pseudomonas monteilii]MCE0980957.1 hypothetical protein [Pseudomonas monteilii]MCE1012276.1 hypothetical protein [Pseudomonas monteilii]MCE1040982.1 hypothetical protein [Pseudomonas monteilii]
MSAINRFHEVANDALVQISDHLVPGAKLTLAIYVPGEPEQDIVLMGPGAAADEVVNTLRRRAALSLDGENAYKQGVCDVAVGAMAAGKQNNNQPPEGHWGQRFWDIGRAEGALQEEVVSSLKKVVADLFYQIEAKHGPKAAAEYPSIAEAKALIAKLQA